MLATSQGYIDIVNILLEDEVHRDDQKDCILYAIRHSKLKVVEAFCSHKGSRHRLLDVLKTPSALLQEDEAVNLLKSLLHIPNLTFEEVIPFTKVPSFGGRFTRRSLPFNLHRLILERLKDFQLHHNWAAEI
jgi:hypothetical protein